MSSPVIGVMARSFPNAADRSAADCDNTRCPKVLKARCAATLFKYEQMAAGVGYLEATLAVFCLCMARFVLFRGGVIRLRSRTGWRQQMSARDRNILLCGMLCLVVVATVSIAQAQPAMLRLGYGAAAE
jgi:hypothetical protein